MRARVRCVESVPWVFVVPGRSGDAAVEFTMSADELAELMASGRDAVAESARLRDGPRQS